MRRSLFCAGVALVTAISALPLSLGAQAGRSGDRWVGTWATAVVARPQGPPVPAPVPAGSPCAPPVFGPGPGRQGGGPPPNFPAPINISNQTLRQIVHVSLGGERIRVVLSNAFGSAPLAVGAAHVALRTKEAAIDIKSDRAAPQAIEQRVHFADDHSHKHRILDHLLADIAITQSIVFIATKRDAESLAQRLKGEGHAAAALHGDMSQHERTSTLREMRRGRVRTLVATDVAARGIDVPAISHVINFDLPRQADDYVHRIGRTGRAGAAGIAVSLANHAERGTLRQIERHTGAAIAASEIPGLEPRRRESRAAPRTAPRGGFGKAGARTAHAPSHARSAQSWDDRKSPTSGRGRDGTASSWGFRGGFAKKS